MTAILRPYQTDLIERVRQAFSSGKRAPLIVSPTGSGKTVTLSHIVAGAVRKNRRVLVMAHRAELVDQLHAALQLAEVPAGIIAADYPAYRNEPAAVASVQTLARRLTKLPVFDLVICDEAHHVTAKNQWGKIFQHWPNAARIGVTATPTRLGGEALGDVFDALVLGPSVQQLTDDGFLVPARIFAPPTVDVSGMHVRAGEYVQSEVATAMEKPSIVGDAISHYRQHAAGKRAVCFCFSIQHSLDMAAAFRAAGFVAAHLDGTTDRDLRRRMIDDFRTGRLTVLCSVDVVGEGLDIPNIECGILLRPTASEVVYLQQIGRCLRPAPGKDVAIILDHVGNCMRHGLPSEDREWSLEGRKASHRSRDAADKSIRVCPKCFAAQYSGSRACRVCGHEFEVKAREIQEREGELQELTAEMMEKRDKRRTVGRAKTLEELLVIEKARGYKAGWAQHVFAAKVAKRHGLDERAATHEGEAEQRSVLV